MCEIDSIVSLVPKKLKGSTKTLSLLTKSFLNNSHHNKSNSNPKSHKINKLSKYFYNINNNKINYKKNTSAKKQEKDIINKIINEKEKKSKKNIKILSEKDLLTEEEEPTTPLMNLQKLHKPNYLMKSDFIKNKSLTPQENFYQNNLCPIYDFYKMDAGLNTNTTKHERNEKEKKLKATSFTQYYNQFKKLNYNNEKIENKDIIEETNNEQLTPMNDEENYNEYNKNFFEKNIGENTPASIGDTFSPLYDLLGENIFNHENNNYNKSSPNYQQMNVNININNNQQNNNIYYHFPYIINNVNSGNTNNNYYINNNDINSEYDNNTYSNENNNVLNNNIQINENTNLNEYTRNQLNKNNYLNIINNNNIYQENNNIYEQMNNNYQINFDNNNFNNDVNNEEEINKKNYINNPNNMNFYSNLNLIKFSNILKYLSQYPGINNNLNKNMNHNIKFNNNNYINNNSYNNKKFIQKNYNNYNINSNINNNINYLQMMSNYNDNLNNNQFNNFTQENLLFNNNISYPNQNPQIYNTYYPNQTNLINNNLNLNNFTNNNFVQSNINIEQILLKMSPYELAQNCHIYSQYQSGCRYLQEFISNNSYDKNLIKAFFEKVLEYIKDLSKGQFSHYFVKKLLFYLNEFQILRLIKILSPVIEEICTNQYGTKVIQDLIDLIKTEKAYFSLLNILTPYIKQLIIDLNGMQIVYKLITKYKNVTIIENIICTNIKEIANSKKGSNFLIKYFEFAKEENLLNIKKNILLNLKDIITDQFGNYVIQKILLKKDSTIVNVFVEEIKNNIIFYSNNKYSSNAVEKCFDNDNIKNDVLKLFMIKDNFEKILLDKYGNYVAQKAIAKANNNEKKILIDLLKSFIPELKNKYFGEKLLNKMEYLYPNFFQSFN